MMRCKNYSANSLLRAACVCFSLAVSSFHAVPAEVFGGEAVPPEPIDPSQLGFEVQRDGTIQISYRRIPIVTGKHVAWGPNWKWANFGITATPADKGHAIQGRCDGLSLTYQGHFARPEPQTLDLQYELTASQTLPGIIGAGIEWKVSLAADVLAGITSQPELLPDSAGWSWQLDADATITVRSGNPLAECYFEKGNPAQIRTLLVAKSLSKGTKKHRITLSLPDGGGKLVSLNSLYEPPDPKTWNFNAIEPFSVPADVSFLNDGQRPAGKHGFLKVDGDRFTFEDGTPARFWGANVAAYALFDDVNEIRVHARRIAQLGFNLIRIHHHDSPWVGSNVVDRDAPTSQVLNQRSMEKLDWWIKCLKDEGVYVWLDLHVGREFKPGDNIPGFDEVARQKGIVRGFNYFNERIEQLMRDFQEAYLTHRNPYTGLRYLDDPAVAMLQITNENDLVTHFGNLMLPDKNNPFHQRLFEEQADLFSKRTGHSRARVWRTWETGPSKLLLADLEHHFNVRMLRHLRSLGAKVPISTTSYWSAGCPAALASLTDGDYIDIHSYGGEHELFKDPRYESGMLSAIQGGCVAGKPITISEWNVEHPKRDRFTSPLRMAAVAAHQGWDAVLLYNYSQMPLSGRKLDTWSTFLDPAMTSLMPAAAVLYRSGHVKESPSQAAFQIDTETLQTAGMTPASFPNLRIAGFTHRTQVLLPECRELDWLDVDPSLSDPVIPLAGKNPVPRQAGDQTYRSDTKQLLHDFRNGVMLIDTPYTQAAMGAIGGRSWSLSSTSFQVETPVAAIAVTSLDGRPLATSRRILVTEAAQAFNNPGGQGILSQPLSGTVRLQSTLPAQSSQTRRQSKPASIRVITSTQGERQLEISLPATPGRHTTLFESSAGSGR